MTGKLDFVNDLKSWASTKWLKNGMDRKLRDDPTISESLFVFGVKGGFVAFEGEVCLKIELVLDIDACYSCIWLCKSV